MSRIWIWVQHHLSPSLLNLKSHLTRHSRITRLSCKANSGGRGEEGLWRNALWLGWSDSVLEWSDHSLHQTPAERLAVHGQFIKGRRQWQQRGKWHNNITECVFLLQKPIRGLVIPETSDCVFVFVFVCSCSCSCLCPCSCSCACVCVCV